MLHCDPLHAPGVTPGVANITAVVETDGDDLVLKTTVTVVGPPAANGVTVTASPASLICGEKATITVNVKDSIGQNVSDHTLVEAVTNRGRRAPVVTVPVVRGNESFGRTRHEAGAAEGRCARQEGPTAVFSA